MTNTDSMKITVFGSGYVGLTQAICLAQVGHKVCCVDIDRDRIAQLNQGVLPLHEPGMDVLLRHSLDSGHLFFTVDTKAGVDFAQVLFIAVGTPAGEDGSADLRQVFGVVDGIARYADEAKLVINKSTCPVGTVQRIRARLLTSARTLAFEVVSNPEFLREGSAIDDCMAPERIIIGVDGKCDGALMATLHNVFRPFYGCSDQLILMCSRSAELTKYAANSMLATRISFINEMANLAERLGADIEMVSKGIGSDSRIGRHFIRAGSGYGGSCIPKDMRALQHMASSVGYEAHLLDAVESINRRQKRRVFQNILHHYDHDLSGKTFALWGLSFKPNTDDMREAPSRTLLEDLWASGARIRAFDPEAMEEVRRSYGNRQDLFLAKNKEEVLEGADALVIVTEWSQFHLADFGILRWSLRDGVVFDGRNLFEPTALAEAGLTYYSIGRAIVEAPTSCTAALV